MPEKGTDNNLADRVDRIIDTACELIRFETDSDNIREIERSIDFVEEFFQGTGLKVIRKKFGDKPLVLVTADEKAHHELCLCGHIDVIKADKHMFEPKVNSGRLYGRGAGDMKGPLAALMYVMKDVVAGSENPDRISLLVVSDEEIGGKFGAKKMIEAGYKPGFLLAGEPTALRVANKSKGLIQLRITAKGKAGHGSRPWDAISAVDKLLKALAKLKEMYPTPTEETWSTTAMINIIRGGDAFNVIPGVCEAEVDMRYLPDHEPDEVISTVISALDDVEVKVIQKTPACNTPDDDPNVKGLLQASELVISPRPLLYKHAASDARYFSAVGVPAVAFGPSAAGVHSDNEWLDLEELDFYYRILEKYAHRICQP